MVHGKFFPGRITPALICRGHQALLHALTKTNILLLHLQNGAASSDGMKPLQVQRLMYSCMTRKGAHLVTAAEAVRDQLTFAQSCLSSQYSKNTVQCCGPSGTTTLVSIHGPYRLSMRFGQTQAYAASLSPVTACAHTGPPNGRTTLYKVPLGHVEAHLPLGIEGRG